MSIKTVLTVIIFIATTTWSATEKYGVITRNERWTLDESPIMVTDDIVISPMARVVITPGVKILIAKPVAYKKEIPQEDNLDSTTISIRVLGGLKCVGRIDNRISFSSQFADSQQCEWYGLILENGLENEIEIAYTDIAEACNGITVKKGSPLLRNNIFEFNNTGVIFKGGSKAKMFNSIVSSNITTGIFIENSNPTLYNNIIVKNRNSGVWSDGLSKLDFKYNCVFNNGDENYYKTDPRYGVAVKVNNNKDSVDFAFNLLLDPIFAGTAADSLAIENDLTLPTDKSRIKDTTIAKVITPELTDSLAAKRTRLRAKRYYLSPYSPCINAGKKGKIFLDLDETRNDMGIYGGQEFGDY